MPATALFPATPAVTVDGDANGALEASLESLVVTADIDGMVTAEALYQNVGSSGKSIDYQFFDQSIIDFGSEIAFEAGADEGRGEIFAGVVSGIRADYSQSGTSRLAVLAEDGLQALRMTRRSRVFEDVSDADVISSIAGDHGLTGDIDLPGPVRTAVAQIDQSDLAFIRDRALLAGGELWIEGTTLRVLPRTERRADPVTLSFRQNLREASLTADLIDQRTSISIGGWDSAAKQSINAEATVNSLASERDGGTAGAELIDQVFGNRAERLVHHVPFDAEQAQVIADARFRQVARRFVTGEIEAEGDARLTVGAVVDLVGLGPWFNGSYDVVRSQHLFDLDAGYRTILSVERAELGL